MDEVEAIRVYEGGVLRPNWDLISTQAAVSAGVLNWESAPASAWNRDQAVSYADKVVKWAIQIPRVLEARDPEGTSTDPRLTSLRRLFDFHVAKMIHLQKLGISVPRVPSTLEAAWEGFKQGTSDLVNTGPFGIPWKVLGIGVGLVAFAYVADILFVRGRR